MELKTVRKEMNAGELKGLIDLPNYEDDQRVSITVSPAAEKEEKKILSDEEIEELLDRMEGCLQNLDPSKTLDDWRKERLEERYGIKFAD